tara:strand:+ start:24683 stop:25318 length:636 start_codon:yes stop_codon:yes gene_type:complete
MYNPAIHKRRSIRLNNYDYSGEGLYFITLCVADRKNVFGEILNGEMHLNAFGDIAAEEWAKSPEIRKNISLGNFIIMPNHMHGIISIDFAIDSKAKEYIGKFHSPTQTIGAIIRGYKGATTKRINNLIRQIKEDYRSTGELQFAPTVNPSNIKRNAPADNLSIIQQNSLTGEGSIWQRDYYEHIIRTDIAYQNISNYILNNPSKWERDKLK